MILSDKELHNAQNLMIKILTKVHEICIKYNIKYWLDSGTLIGAVRHNGFIPWDDDLDIGMLREDYDKFCNLALSELGQEFTLVDENLDKHYGNQFAKVMLNGTKWIENQNRNTKSPNKGLYIDIFPYDKIPSNEDEQNKVFNIYPHLNYAILAKLKYDNKLKKANVIEKLKDNLKRFFINFIPLTILKKERFKLCTKYRYLENNFVITKYGGNLRKNINNYTSYSNFVLHKFEDSEFYIPKDYDSILKNLYGDYMQLPPIEERRNHGIVDYDFGIYKDNV